MLIISHISPVDQIQQLNAAPHNLFILKGADKEVICLQNSFVYSFHIQLKIEVPEMEHWLAISNPNNE